MGRLGSRSVCLEGSQATFPLLSTAFNAYLVSHWLPGSIDSGDSGSTGYVPDLPKKAKVILQVSHEHKRKGREEKEEGQFFQGKRERKMRP